jgi:hypothetical protein
LMAGGEHTRTGREHIRGEENKAVAWAVRERSVTWGGVVGHALLALGDDGAGLALGGVVIVQPLQDVLRGGGHRHSAHHELLARCNGGGQGDLWDRGWGGGGGERWTGIS